MSMKVEVDDLITFTQDFEDRVEVKFTASIGAIGHIIGTEGWDKAAELLGKELMAKMEDFYTIQHL